MEIVKIFNERRKIKKPIPQYLIHGLYDVKSVGLSIRLKNVLLQHDFQYLSDLTVIESKDLYLMRNFGKKSFKELEQIMLQYGLKFADY